MQLHNLVFALVACFPLANAQFNFFDHMFGHPQQQQQQQQQQRGSSDSQWMAYSEARQYPYTQRHTHHKLTVVLVSCSQYLCPDTLSCVKRPADCPCPDKEDIKCTVPDALETHAATAVCVRGLEECASVERLMRSYST